MFAGGSCLTWKKHGSTRWTMNTLRRRASRQHSPGRTFANNRRSRGPYRVQREDPIAGRKQKSISQTAGGVQQIHIRVARQDGTFRERYWGKVVLTQPFLLRRLDMLRTKSNAD